MKNLIIILITVFSFQIIKAQEYTATDKYTIENAINTKQKEYTTTSFNVITTEESTRKIASLDIVDTEFLEDIKVSVLTNPDLENIKEVIKVDINYNTCCVYAETYYFMVTETNDFIALPYIENIYCESTVSDVQYVFPNQVNGKENIILKKEIKFIEEFTVKNSKVLQSFFWNDDASLIGSLTEEY